MTNLNSFSVAGNLTGDPKIKTDAAIPTSNASSPFSFFSKRARKTAAIPIIPIFIIDITYETGFPSL